MYGVPLVKKKKKKKKKWPDEFSIHVQLFSYSLL